MLPEESGERTGRLFRGGLAAGIKGRGAVGGSIAGCDSKSIVVAVVAIVGDMPPVCDCLPTLLLSTFKMPASLSQSAIFTA